MDSSKGANTDPWADFANAVMFTFTVITTIGYGHVAPTTWQGRLVCCVYGLIGIPLAMMTVANVGKGLMEVFTKISNRLTRWKDSCILYVNGFGKIIAEIEFVSILNLVQIVRQLSSPTTTPRFIVVICEKGRKRRVAHE
jgi:hypothetical protein